MIDPLLLLTDADLQTLATVLRDGRIVPPFTALAVGRFVGVEVSDAVSYRLLELTDSGMRPEHVAVVLEAMAAGRADRSAPADAVELVWTGPQAAGVDSRDTAVVVRELFARATESVLVAGFAVYQGRSVFRGLAERMAACPGLQVRLFLDVHHRQDTSFGSDIIRRFARKFIEKDWPANFPFPEVYYDPRSLDPDPSKRASLHAKCVVVDRQVVLITSANFTEAAHERNIEAGAMIRSPRIAARLSDNFTGLVEASVLRRIPL